MTLSRLSTLALLALAPALLALQARSAAAPGKAAARDHARPELHITPVLGDLATMRAELPALAAAGDRFQARAGGRWMIVVDRLSGNPALIEGSGLAWAPGRGNNLTAAEAGPALADLASDGARDELVAKARALVAEHPDLFGGVRDADLVLNEIATGPMLNYLYTIDFDWRWHGIPVEGAHVVFRVNHGNLVQFGQERIAPVRIAGLSPRPRLELAGAWRVAREQAGLPSGALLEIVEAGRLAVLPTQDRTIDPAAPGRAGAALGYKLAWILSWRQAGAGGTWETRVDAHSGEVLAHFDANDYGHIQGKAYTQDGQGTEVSMPFSFANYSGTTNFADAAGNFTGTVGTSTMFGQYVRIIDSCGAISLAANATGLIDFGGSTGTNCSTPGTGGAGNTHASRTQYWNLDAIKQKGRVYLPTNNWLQGRITANVNLTAADSPYCPANAWWDGSAVNFCVSGSGYANTGELPGVSLHEWGHGMDNNDGRAPADRGTGETYGDVTAALQTHDSCIGDGFASGNCGGYGDSCRSCSGVRDIDYGQHQSNSPHTPDNFIRPRCPASATYKGPCGDEGHCESYVSSEAVWDLGVRDLTSASGGSMDQTSAWQHLDRLWYASRPNATGAFTCTAGATYTSNGCGTGNLFTVFRVVDDCDGNLANGTPHAAAIWNAFNRHAIGCSTVVNTNQTGCCPSLAAPVASATPGNNSVTVNWNDIANATRYKVYRNAVSCTAGFTEVATVNDPTVAHTDTTVSNGTAYYYRVQAYAASDACAGAMGNCVTVTPNGASCTAPSGLANNTAVDASACGATGVTVSWTAPGAWGDTAGTRTWTVLRNGTALASGPCSGALAAATLTCTDTTAVAGAAYTYSVRANNGCGMSTTTAGASATDVNNAPAAPTSASATAGNCADITVSWTNGLNATSHNLLRTAGACPPGGGTTTFTGVTTPYADTTAASGSSYCYVARAVNACGTADAAGVTGTRGALLAAPAAPTATGACGQVNLSWGAVAGATSYTLQRSSGTCASATQLVAGVTGTTYADTSAVPGTNYIYRILAVNGCGASAPSTCSGNAISFTAPAPTVTGAASACTSTGLSTQAFTAYQWNLGGTPIGGATAQNHTATASGSYTVTVTNAGGCSATSPAHALTINTAPPAPVQTAPAAGNTQVTVNWNAAAGASTYQVKRGNSGGPYNNIGGAQPGLSYLDSGLTNGTQYCYVIAATNSCGTSGNSNQQCATPALCSVNTRLSDNFESGTANWNLAGGNFNWAASTAAAGSPATSIAVSDPNGNADRNKCGYAQSAAALPISAGATGATLTFWSQSALAADDHGIVETSIDGGASWSKLTTVNYPDSASAASGATCASVTLGAPAFGGTRAGALYRGDLTAFAGQALLIRFTMVTGGTKSAGSTWYVDDVEVTDGSGVAGAMTILGHAKSGADLMQSWATGAGARNYLVYRNTAPNTAAWTTPSAVTAAGATGWTDAGQLASGTSQFYSVTLHNGCAETAK